MNPQSAAAAYKEGVFENAPPIKIVRLMYQGALRFLEQAEALDPEAQFREFGDKLNRAEAVVAELRMSLEAERAPEIARSLNALYLFVERQIKEAFLERTHAPLKDARDILTTLFDAWTQINAQEA